MARILFLYNLPRNAAGTSVEHVAAFKRYSHHELHFFDSLTCRFAGGETIPCQLDLDWFDGIVIHYSIYMASESFLDLRTRMRIARFSGFKIAFIQDEYRDVDKTIAVLKEMNVGVLFTCVPDEEVEKVYATQKLPGLRKINNLTGYVSEELLRFRGAKPIASRALDVGYRARRLPAWLGELGREKSTIAERFLAFNGALNAPLRCDISCEERDRIYGDAWLRFIGSCRTMLGVESGASVFDFKGDIQAKVSRYLSEHPDTDFETLKEMFFASSDGAVSINQISPRCFEAIALKTPLVLFEGRYSGVLLPDRHYIELKKDFSNFDEVVSKIRDTRYLQELADRAFAEVATNRRYSYESFVAGFDRVVEESREEKGVPASLPEPKYFRLRFWYFNRLHPYVTMRFLRAWLARLRHACAVALGRVPAR